MSDDRDKPVERPRRVRPGRIRAERSEGRGLLLRKLSARTQTRPTRSRTKGRALQRPGYGPGARQQRSVVKVQYTANRTPGGWRAHGRYLAREGAQRERGGYSGWLALPHAMPQVNLRTKQREGSALTFEEVEKTSGKRLEAANRDLGRYEGKLVAWARDAQGRHHLVLDVGPYLVAIPSQRQALERGAQVRVRYERPSSEQGLGLRAGWQVIDRERKLDRGRGR